MARPRKADAPTAVERSRASRERREVRAIELPAAVIAKLEAIRERDGDASRAAVVTRLAEEAVGDSALDRLIPAET